MSRPVFQLHLHTRQGNDLGNWLDDTKTPSHAFAEWGKSFREHEKFCVRLANALEGLEMQVEARGDCIFLLPGDEKAEAALRDLEKEEIVFVVDEKFDAWWEDMPTQPDGKAPDFLEEP